MSLKQIFLYATLSIYKVNRSNIKVEFDQVSILKSLRQLRFTESLETVLSKMESR